VRVRGNVEAERRELDARLALIVPGGISDIHSLDQHRAAGLYAFRAASLIEVAVGGLALLLTVFGFSHRPAVRGGSAGEGGDVRTLNSGPGTREPVNLEPNLEPRNRTRNLAPGTLEPI
jgi:hypothetical protein